MNQILYSKKTADLARRVAIIFCILFILLIVASVSFGIANKSNEKILKGVFVGGVDVSNLTKEQAVQKINEVLKDIKDNKIILKIEEKEETVIAENFGINCDEKMIDIAYNYGRTGNLLADNYTVLFSYFGKTNEIPIGVNIEKTKIENIILKMTQGMNIIETNDTYKIEDGKLVITKGRSGYAIEYEELEKQILNKVFTDNPEIIVPLVEKESVRISIDEIYDEIYVEAKNAEYKSGETFEVIPEVNGVSFDKEKAKVEYEKLLDGETMEIELKITIPEKTVANLNDILFKDVLATYSTKYDTGYTARVTNLKVAAKNINGTILYPNEEFSYNKVVGARTYANGFREAHVFAGGEVVDGLGGGICQISSTLYNSVLLSNLEVTERKSHMMHTGYTDPGRDATVVYGTIDFKFKNNRSTPIKIETTVEKGIATATIYGLKTENELKVEIKTVILKTIPWTTVTREDATMNKGTTKVTQYPMNGYVSETYKILKDAAGKEISNTLVSKDTYKQTSKIIKVGTKEVVIINPQPQDPIDNPPVEPQDPTPPDETTKPDLPPGWDNPESPYA